MVEVSVRQDKPIDPADAARPEVGSDVPPGHVRPVDGAGIVDDDFTVRRFKDGAPAIPHRDEGATKFAWTRRHDLQCDAQAPPDCAEAQGPPNGSAAQRKPDATEQ